MLKLSWFNAQPCFYQPQHFYLKNTSLEVSARSHVYITDDRNVSEILLRSVCAWTRKHILCEHSLFFEPSILYVKLYYNFTQWTCIEITLKRKKPVTRVSTSCLANSYNENRTHSSHLFQCPSERPCKEEKPLRFPNKILDSSRLLIWVLL